MGRKTLPFLPFALAALISILASLALLEVYRLQVDRWEKAARADVVTHLGAVRARLEGVLTEPLLITRGLQADIIVHGDIADDEFLRLSAVMLVDYPAIRNLTLARGTVISAVYPSIGNRAVIGVDYRSRPEQWETVERAISTRRPVLAGPVPLIQGGSALIGRVPVFLPPERGGEPRFFGLISVVIDVPLVLAAAGVHSDDLPISLAIRGRDGLGVAGGMIWGDEAIFSGFPVEMDVRLPGGAWRLAATAKKTNDGELMITRLLGSFIALLVGLVSFGTAFYIRSLRRAHVQAGESEERYRALVETSPMAVCVHRDGRVIFVNSEAFRMMGASSQADFIGRNIFDIILPEYRDRAHRRVSAVMAEGLTVPMLEEKILTFDGRCLDVDVVSSRVMMDGRPAVLSVINDVTLRHQAEIERERLVQTLQRSNEDLLQFAYIASHDLQEPLRNIASYVQLLGRRYRGKLDSDADQFIDYAVAGAKRMQTMIADLLDYSSLSGEGGAGQPTESSEVLKQVLADLSMVIEESGAVVEASNLPVVLVRPHELARIFQNLIGNSIKYRKTNLAPRIWITAKPVGREWIFSVSDNGIGVEHNYQEKIFTMFQRLHARDAYEGTGIGLAICRKLVQHNGGRIWFEANKEPEGSVFCFTLPMVM